MGLMAREIIIYNVYIMTIIIIDIVVIIASIVYYTRWAFDQCFVSFSH